MSKPKLELTWIGKGEQPKLEPRILIEDPSKSYGDKKAENMLIYGDNLLVMQALLAGDEAQGLPSMRGTIDLIYIDPPFDSKADYRTKITLPSGNIEQRPTVIEQFAYSDTWKDGTVSYLKMMYPRLVLMKELLANSGSIYVHIDWHVGHYVKVILDEIFDKEHFLNEIIWKRRGGKTSPDANRMENIVDYIMLYTKSTNKTINLTYTKEGSEKYIKEQFKYVDENGRRYRISPLNAPEPRDTRP